MCFDGPQALMYRCIMVLLSLSVLYVQGHNFTADCHCGVNRVNIVPQWVSVGYYRFIIILQSVSVRYIKGPYFIAVYVSVLCTGSIFY